MDGPDLTRTYYVTFRIVKRVKSQKKVCHSISDHKNQYTFNHDITNITEYGFYLGDSNGSNIFTVRGCAVSTTQSSR